MDAAQPTTNLYRKRIAVIGSRKFRDEQSVKSELAIMLAGLPDGIMVVSGGAPGVDTWAKQLCEKLEIPFDEMPAEWEKYGKAAGMIRNKQLLDTVETFIAFWDGTSPGTKGAIDYATKKRIPGKIYLRP